MSRAGALCCSGNDRRGNNIEFSSHKGGKMYGYAIIYTEQGAGRVGQGSKLPRPSRGIYRHISLDVSRLNKDGGEIHLVEDGATKF